MAPSKRRGTRASWMVVSREARRSALGGPMKVEIRSTLALVLLGAVACTDARIGDGARRDVPLVLHDGYQHRVVMKLADGEVAGASGGKVDFVPAASSAPVAELAAAHGLELRPLLALRDAQLDALGA